MRCTNCGNKVPDTANVCGNCGHRLKSRPTRRADLSQEQGQFTPVAIRSVVPGWAWGVIGLLLGIIVTGGLILGGVIAVDLPSFNQPAPIAASTPFESTPVSDFEGYCPDSAGVILFWNSDENCVNSAGDAGYRQRIGDGAQDVNTGQFDNQATSIKIPKGWSVRLWENPGLTGGNICFILSVRDFTPKGAFPGSNTAINDNVSSMEVFRDSSCGEDLAAGALPAPWPEGMRDPGGQDGQEPVNDENAVCDDITPCGCLPEELQVLIGEDGEEAAIEFVDRYIEAVWVQDDKIEFDLKDFDGILEQLEGTKLEINIEVAIGGLEGEVILPITLETECKQNEENPALITCAGVAPEGITFPFEDTALEISVDYVGENVFAECFAVSDNDDVLGLQSSGPQCVSPKGVACGSICCADREACVPKRGKLVCENAREADEEQSEPKKECAPYDSCCLSGTGCSP